jgi:hypothetical protein
VLLFMAMAAVSWHLLLLETTVWFNCNDSKKKDHDSIWKEESPYVACDAHWRGRLTQDAIFYGK